MAKRLSALRKCEFRYRLPGDIVARLSEARFLLPIASITSMSDHLEFGLYDRSQETLITYNDLPHWFQPNVAVFITFRTIDSLPQSAVLRMEAELRDWLNRNGQPLPESRPLPDWSDLPTGLQQEYRQRKSKLWHWEVDCCHGECVLRNPDLSKIVIESLRHFDGERYHIARLGESGNIESILSVPVRE